MFSHRRSRSAGALLFVALLCASLIFPGLAAAQEAPPEAASPPPPVVLDPEGRVIPVDDARLAPDAIDAQSMAAAPSGDYRIDTLVSGYQWPASWTQVTYSFYEDSVFGGAYYGTEIVSEVSEQVKTNVRQIMAWYATIMDMNFVEVTETSSNIGYIRFMRSTAPNYAYAYYPSGTALFSVVGDVHLQVTYDRAGDTNGFQNPPGYHGYLSIVHEIGHALGLKHPFDAPVMPEPEDNYSHTVMTYDFLGNSAGTPMPYDMMALAYLYGSRAKNAGNDTYAFTSRGLDQYVLNGATYWVTPGHAQQTLWDTGGYNTLDLSGIPGATDYRLDINGLGWLTRTADFHSAADETYMQYGSRLGNGVVIQQVVNSAGNDTIYANSAPNVFSGYSRTRVTGADVLYDATAADTLDLSGYSVGEVTQAQSGSDHVITFPASNGSVTIVNYYGGNAPALAFDVVIPTISINDVTVTEGNSGTIAATFTVSLSQPTSSTITMNFATQDGTATAPADYATASGVVTFAPNVTSQAVTVQVTGDTGVETDETFYVSLSNPSVGAAPGDMEGMGTILNDDQPPNTLPVAVFSATPTTGFAPLPVSFNGSGSYDPDGTIASYAWSFGDGATGSGATLSHTYNTAGTYNAVLTVTDNRGGTDTESATITVTQNPDSKIDVWDITGVQVTVGRNKAAQVTVTVKTAGGALVSGATVAGNWTGLVKGSSTGMTGTNGTVTLTSKTTTKSGTITFTVSNVTPPASLQYDRNLYPKESATVTITK